MSETHNGIELKAMTHNGEVVERWIHNGVEVFLNFPYKPSQVVGEFEYTGAMQSFIPLADGLYLLEAYGGQGEPLSGSWPDKSGRYIGTGGKGGYAKYHAVLAKGVPVYIYVGGGAGNTFNGGGAGGTGAGAKGGGATHFAMIDGTLRNIGASRKSQILCVAGGGGGAGNSSEPYSLNGGSGGGTNGERTYYGSEGASIVPGTQNSGYMFGQGGPTTNYGSCGGGGLYGGYGSGNYNGAVPAAGGSGYIVASSTVRDGKTYANSMSNGLRSGNGYAKITFIAR